MAGSQSNGIIFQEPTQLLAEWKCKALSLDSPFLLSTPISHITPKFSGLKKCNTEFYFFTKGLGKLWIACLFCARVGVLALWSRGRAASRKPPAQTGRWAMAIFGGSGEAVFRNPITSSQGCPHLCLPYSTRAHFVCLLFI